MAKKDDHISGVQTVRFLSTLFLVIGFLSVIAGVIVSIQGSILSYDFYSQSTAAERAAGEAWSLVNVYSANIESGKIVANALFMGGLASILFGIGLALIDVLKLGLLNLKIRMGTISMKK